MSHDRGGTDGTTWIHTNHLEDENARKMGMMSCGRVSVWTAGPTKADLIKVERMASKLPARRVDVAHLHPPAREKIPSVATTTTVPEGLIRMIVLEDQCGGIQMTLLMHLGRHHRPSAGYHQLGTLNPQLQDRLHLHPMLLPYHRIHHLLRLLLYLVRWINTLMKITTLVWILEKYRVMDMFRK